MHIPRPVDGIKAMSRGFSGGKEELKSSLSIQEITVQFLSGCPWGQCLLLLSMWKKDRMADRTPRRLCASHSPFNGVAYRGERTGHGRYIKRCGKFQLKIMPIFSCFKRQTWLLAIRYSKHNYPICLSPLKRSTRRSFAPLRKSRRNQLFLCMNRGPSRYNFRAGQKLPGKVWT